MITFTLFALKIYIYYYKKKKKIWIHGRCAMNHKNTYSSGGINIEYTPAAQGPPCNLVARFTEAERLTSAHTSLSP